MRAKILIGFLVIGGLTVTITGWEGYNTGKKALKAYAFNTLTATRENKKSQIEAYFKQIRNQCITFSEDRMIVEAMKDFQEAFSKIAQNPKDILIDDTKYIEGVKSYYKKNFLPRLNPNVERERLIDEYLPEDLSTLILQYNYLSNNPNNVGSKDNLIRSDDQRIESYNQVHARYHSIIQNYLKKFGYYDIFLVDVDTGNIVYTVFKEVDFGTSLLSGPYKDTNFARAFKLAKEAPKNKDFAVLVDYESYDPSYAAPAAFIASPIYDNGKKIGVLLFQMPIDEINRIMTNDEQWREMGMGNTGETYLIGNDYRMRSQSRFLIENPDGYFETLENIGTDIRLVDKMRLLSTSILFQEIVTKQSKAVLRDEEDTIIANSYRGESVLSSYSMLEIDDVQWAILAEIDAVEIFAPIYKLSRDLLFWSIIILFFLIISSYFYTRFIADPIRKIIYQIQTYFDEGINFTKSLTIKSKDDIGRLAGELNHFIHQINEYIQKISMNKDYLVTSGKEISHSVDNLKSCQKHAKAEFEEFLLSLNTTVDHFSKIEAFFKETNRSHSEVEYISKKNFAICSSIDESIEKRSSSVNQLKKTVQKSINDLDRGKVYKNRIVSIFLRIEHYKADISFTIKEIIDDIERLKESNSGETIAQNNKGVKKKQETLFDPDSTSNHQTVNEFLNRLQKSLDKLDLIKTVLIESIDKGQDYIDAYENIFGQTQGEMQLMQHDIKNLFYKADDITQGLSRLSESNKDIVNRLYKIDYTEIKNILSEKKLLSTKLQKYKDKNLKMFQSIMRFTELIEKENKRLTKIANDMQAREFINKD